MLRMGRIWWPIPNRAVYKMTKGLSVQTIRVMAKTVGGSFLFLLVATLFVYLFFFPPFLPSHELRLSIKHKYTYRVHLWWCQKYLHRQRRAAILEVAVEVDSWCRLSFSLDPTSVASDSRALPYWPTSKAFDISVTGPRRILMVFHNSKNKTKICISLIHRREKCPIKKMWIFACENTCLPFLFRGRYASGDKRPAWDRRPFWQRGNADVASLFCLWQASPVRPARPECAIAASRHWRWPIPLPINKETG